MKKVNELGIGAFRPDGVSFGSHKSGLTTGPRSDADSNFSRSQQRLAYSKEDLVFEDDEEEILENRVHRNGKFCLLETLYNLNEDPKDDYRRMANKINRQAEKRLNNIDDLESLDDMIDEMSAGGVPGVGAPMGYTSKGKPETPSQRKKRQKFNREKSYPLGESLNSNGMNLIMEGWREFLSTITAGNIDHRKRKEVEYTSSLSDVALYVEKKRGGKEYSFYLYKPVGFNGATPVIDNINLPEMVGFVTVNKLSSNEKPCIPMTYDVSFSAVAKKFQRKGMGSLLYDIASTVLKQEEDAGITSDHGAGTSTSARRVWDKIEKSLNYIKKTTPDGNDTFDYSGTATPFDDQDDCVTGSSPPASDHSHQIIIGINEKVESMRRLNSKYIQSAVRITDRKMNKLLKASASDTFWEVY